MSAGGSVFLIGPLPFTWSEVGQRSARNGQQRDGYFKAKGGSKNIPCMETDEAENDIFL